MEGFLRQQEPLLTFLGRLEALEISAPPEGSPRDLVAGVEMAVVAPEQALDGAQRQRLEKEAQKVAGEIAGAEARLSNEGFLRKAPPQVIEGNRQRLSELRERHRRLLDRLGA